MEKGNAFSLKWQAPSINSVSEMRWRTDIYILLCGFFFCVSASCQKKNFWNSYQTQSAVTFKSSVLYYSSYSQVLDCTQPAAQSVQCRTWFSWNGTKQVHSSYQVILWTKGQTSNRCVRLLQCHTILFSKCWARNKWRKGMSEQHRIFNIDQWLHIRRQL